MSKLNWDQWLNFCLIELLQDFPVKYLTNEVSICHSEHTLLWNNSVKSNLQIYCVSFSKVNCKTSCPCIDVLLLLTKPTELLMKLFPFFWLHLILPCPTRCNDKRIKLLLSLSSPFYSITLTIQAFYPLSRSLGEWSGFTLNMAVVCPSGIILRVLKIAELFLSTRANMFFSIV